MSWEWTPEIFENCHITVSCSTDTSESWAEGKAMIISIIILNLTSTLWWGQGRFSIMMFPPPLATDAPLYPPSHRMGDVDVIVRIPSTWEWQLFFPSKCHKSFLPCSLTRQMRTCCKFRKPEDAVKIGPGMRSLVVAEGGRSFSWSPVTVRCAEQIRRRWHRSPLLLSPAPEAGQLKSLLLTKSPLGWIRVKWHWEGDFFSNNVIAVEKKISMWLFRFGLFFILYEV